MKPIYLRIAGGIIAMLTVLLAVVITQPTKTPKQEPETPNEIIDDYQAGGFLGMRRLCSQPHQTTLRNSILTLET